MKIVNYKNTARPQDVKIELGQQFPLTIKRLGINGEGVGYFKKKVVFVDGALPEEEVVVEVTTSLLFVEELKLVDVDELFGLTSQPTIIINDKRAIDNFFIL